MDAILRELERQLTGDAGRMVRDLINGGARPLSAAELRMFLTIALLNASQRDLVIRYLMMAARAGLLDMVTVTQAIASAETLAAEAIAAEAAAAEGAAAVEAGAAAGGLGAAGVASVIIMILSILFMIWSVLHELSLTTVVPGPAGIPCGVGTPGGDRMRTLYRTVSAWGIGQTTALNRALSRAEAICNADSAHCTGGCPAGSTCKPSTAVDRVDIFPGFFATRVVVGFTCPCVCA